MLFYFSYNCCGDCLCWTSQGLNSPSFTIKYCWITLSHQLIKSGFILFHKSCEWFVHKKTPTPLVFVPGGCEKVTTWPLEVVCLGLCLLAGISSLLGAWSASLGECQWGLVIFYLPSMSLNLYVTLASKWPNPTLWEVWIYIAIGQTTWHSYWVVGNIDKQKFTLHLAF